MDGTTIRALIHRAYYSSAGTVLSRGFAALTGIVIAGAAGPADFGVYAAVWSVLGLCCSFADMGIVTGLKREGARESERLPELFGNALVFKLITVAPALVVAWAAQLLFVQHDLAKHVFVPLAIASFAMAAAEPCFAVLQLRGEQRDSAAVMALRSAVIFTLVCVIAGHGGGIAAMSWCQAIVSVVIVLGALILVLRRVSLTLAFNRMLRQLRRSIAFGASELVYSAYQNAPILILARFGSEIETGYFALVQRITSLCIVAGTTANSQAFLPALFGLYHQDKERYTGVCIHMQRLFVAIGVSFAATLFVFAEPLLAFIRESYRPAAPIMHWLCWSVLLGYSAIAADAALASGDRMRIKVAVQTGVTFLLISLSVLFAPFFGARGVSAAVLVAGAAGLLGMGGLAWKYKLYAPRGMLSIGIGGTLLIGSAVLSERMVANWPFWGIVGFLGATFLVWVLCFRDVLLPGRDSD